MILQSHGRPCTSPDWKVESETLSYRLLTWTTASPSETEFWWRTHASKAIICYLKIWRMQVWLLIKLWDSLYFHESRVSALKEINQCFCSAALTRGQFERWPLHHPAICSWTRTEEARTDVSDLVLWSSKTSSIDKTNREIQQIYCMTLTHAGLSRG